MAERYLRNRNGVSNETLLIMSPEEREISECRRKQQIANKQNSPHRCGHVFLIGQGGIKPTDTRIFQFLYRLSYQAMTQRV